MTVIYPQSPEFLKTVRKLAKKGYTDKKIARSVGFPPKFFSRLVAFIIVRLCNTLKNYLSIVYTVG